MLESVRGTSRRNWQLDFVSGFERSSEADGCGGLARRDANALSRHEAGRDLAVQRTSHARRAMVEDKRAQHPVSIQKRFRTCPNDLPPSRRQAEREQDHPKDRRVVTTGTRLMREGRKSPCSTSDGATSSRFSAARSLRGRLVARAAAGIPVIGFLHGISADTYAKKPTMRWPGFRSRVTPGIVRT